MKALKNNAVKILWAWTLFLSLATATAHTTWVDADNIADLRTIDPSTDPSTATNIVLVEVPGYYQPGDRGGGMFIWTNSSAADDGGGIIIPNSHSGSGRWMRVFKGETPNVKMWGAKGDGSHNDTIAIQNAVNGRNLLPISEILFPAGSYLVTNTIVFTPIVHIKGEGSFNNTFVEMQGDHDVFRTVNANNAINGAAYDYDHGVIVEGMEIDCDPSSTSAAALVLCRVGEASVIRNLVTAYGGYGIRCFSIGAPGPRYEHVSCFGTHVANFAFDGFLPNGTEIGGGGSISMSTVSGDGSAFGTNCFIRIDDCYAMMSIYDFKGEGSYGGGFIYYKQGLGVPYPGFIGGVNIYGGSYNGSGTNDFVVVNSYSAATPPVLINDVQLYSVRYLVNDLLTGRTTDAFVGGLSQSTARMPVHYEARTFSGNFLTNHSVMTIGDTAIYKFRPPTTGWYRVMHQFNQHFGGHLAVTSPRESSELDFDVTSNLGAPEWINVSRQSGDYVYGLHPYVTKTRAGIFTDGSYDYPFLDIYVGSTCDNDDFVALASPCTGFGDEGLWTTPLITPTSALASIVPPGCTLSSCITNSLTR